MTEINLHINGAEHCVAADPATPLIYVLRNHLGLVGTKFGCGLEQCGACAVLVDGAPVLSCVRPVSESEGTEIRTIEGLASDDCGREVQRVFIPENAA
jgi:nicotinate dehydrogenase subunit A